ncbi:MAG: chitobiase/beta-hexosaminidase C-terminal domain-containing protein, partial [Bacteroidales bacterium]|nr:chitobiase/beta-hexosaminidase C-terminal domain-containing protein [Bacteroidales bacterium]
MRQYYKQGRKLNKLKTSLLMLIMVLFASAAMAQTNVNMSNGTSVVTSAGVNFYDSGGPGGGDYRYQHNEEYIYTFTLPSQQANAGLKVEFSTLRVNDDHLFIYEGTSPNDDHLIADFTCNDYYYSFTDLCVGGNITVLSHSAITFKFVSNEQYRDNGWEASISIVEQTYIASNPPAPVIAMYACENTVELIPTMLSTSPALQLYYSTNGGSSYTEYSTPFDVENGMTVKAYAMLGEAQTATANYHSVEINRAAIAKPTLTRLSENNNLLLVTRPTVPTGANDTYKVRYTLDGSDPTTSGSAITIEWTHVTGQTDINVDTIDMTNATWLSPTGNFQVKAVTQGTTCPDIMSAVETYETTNLHAATPVITFTGTGETGTIAITCATAGADIYYTIDGSIPDPENNPDNTYEWGATGAPTTITAGGTVRAFAVAPHRTNSSVASAIYVPGGESGGSGVYGGVVLLDDREDHTWSYYSDSEQPIHSLKPADVKITYFGYGANTMTTTNTAANNIPNSAFNADVAANQVAVNVGEAGNQFIYLKTLENANAEGSGTNYPYTMIANPFQKRPVYDPNSGGSTFSYTQDFENGNDWTFVQSTTNYWTRGTAASNGGSYGLYITNGNNNNYTNNTTAVSYAYKEFTLSAGTYNISYNWRAYGESNYDYIRVVLAPSNVTLTANQLYDNLTYYSVPNGWTALDGGKLNLQNTWQTGGASFTVAAGTYKVIIVWRNDGNRGTNPPAAIDNISITEGSSSSSDYRGFYAWRIKSLGGGLTISGKSVGDMVYPDEDITFVTSNAEGNEVEFEALWAKAWVTTSTSAMSSGNYATNNGSYKNAYERNFHVVTSLPTHSTYPYTITTINPDGSGTVRSISNSSYSCATDVRLENMTLSITGSAYLNANGHNLHIGRGVANGTSNVASAVYGAYYQASNNTNTTTLDNDFNVRIESGRYSNMYGLYKAASNYQTGRTVITNSFTERVIFGSDYDRAKDNTNNKLIISGAIEVGLYISCSSADAKIAFEALSGTFGSNSANTEMYMGFENCSDSYDCTALRTLDVLGGVFLGGVAGGVDRGASQDAVVLKMRFKGGSVGRYVYGSGQHSSATGSRKTIITGGDYDCWISGACYGTHMQSGSGSSDYSGKTTGNTYVYFGGNANQTNTDGIFGAGYGEDATTEDYYTVLKSFVVVADDATTTGSVYGGGNNGYNKDNAEVWVLGGGEDKLTVSGSVYGGANLSRTEGTTKVTMKGGTVNGSLYGGAQGASASSDIVYVTGTATVDMKGGHVKTDVYGGGYGSRTVIRGNTTVGVSGGTVDGNVYGGGALGTVGRDGNNNGANAVVTISGDAKVNNVYGAGKGTQNDNVPVTNANIFGTTTVTVKEDAHVLGSVYGGGENGSVGYYNNNSTATGSTVNINGGLIDNNVFGGGSYGVTNGNVVVNITWDDDEMTKTQIKGSVYGGAFGTREKVYVKGTKTVNMNNGIVGNSVYGGSRNADDALAWTGTAGTTTTSNVVNISGGEVTYQVFAAGYFGHTYGSAYAFIGEHAINTAQEKAPTNGFDYDINPLYIKGSVWAGADFGNFDGHSFGASTVEGKTYVYIDGTGYNTITANPQVNGYMNIGGSVYGCGTSCDAGKTDTKVVVRNYGQPVANESGAKEAIEEPYQTATRELYSIQRAKTVVLDNAHINYVGQGRVNSLVTTEKYAIHNVETALYVVNSSSVMINRPIDEIKKLVNGSCTNVYAASPTFTPVNLSDGTISVENKYRVYGGTFINVFYTTETSEGTEEKYGELSGFAYMMTDAYEGDENTRSCAYARPKYGQGASFPQGSTAYDNPNDGGFISYNDEYNEFNAAGMNASPGVQMRYENHVYTSKNGEDYFRIWRYGGLHSYREAVLIAESNAVANTYSICNAVVELPATVENGYYRIQVKQSGGTGTTIDYGTDVATCNAGYYGDTYSATASNWMSAGTNAFQTGQSSSDVSVGLACINSYPDVNFGLVAIPQGAMATAGNVNNENWIINEDADAILAGNNTKWTYSDNTEMPEVLFQLTYSNNISVNRVLDPVTIYFEQYEPVYENGELTGYQLADVVEVALIITTKTTINQPVRTRVVALMQGKGECGNVYQGRVTLPSYSVFMNTNGDPSEWTLQSLTWDDEVNGTHTGASMVQYSDGEHPEYEGSDTEFSMLFYAAQNKDYTWGWDDYNYGPFDVTEYIGQTNIGERIGQTMGRKDFTIDFDLYYDGSLKSTTQLMGTLTFTFQFTHYNTGTNDDPVDGTGTSTIVIEVWRKGPGDNYYLDGVNGMNSYAGTRPDAAKLTLNGILSRTEYMAGDNIFIVNTVTQDDAATLSWDGSAYENITIYRYPGGHPMAYGDDTWTSAFYEDYNHDNPCFPGVMVDVKSEMEMHYITLNGYSEEINAEHPVGHDLESSVVEAFAATAPMVRVEKNGKLNLATGTLLTCNANTKAQVGENDIPGGAVKVDKQGTLTMAVNSTITGNSTANTGGGIYMEGTMNIAGLVNVTGNTKATSAKASNENNVYLKEYENVITMTGDVDPESRIGITKDDWKPAGSEQDKWYNPVVFSDNPSRLDVFYTDEDLGRATDDKEMYQLNKLNLSPAEFQNSKKYLFFVGTWVTAVTSEPTGFAADNINTPQKLAWAISVATGYNDVNNGAGYPNTNFKLTADIDMNDNIWVPIGNADINYTGTFDGNGHVVTGIRSPLDASDKGMFGVINGATIENMIISTDFSDGTSDNLGGLVGLMENGTIANCEAAGSVTGNANTQNMGGIAAKVNDGTIHSVFAVSTLTGGEETVMGGLIGTNSGDLYNSYANTTMSGSTTMGGLVGVNKGHVENCYSIIGEQTFPAFAYDNTDGEITVCYTDTPNGYMAAPTTSNATKSNTYGAVEPDIKALGYMFGDNLIAKNTNTYVGNSSVTDAAGLTTYVDKHIPVWNGLLSALNQWVREKKAIEDEEDPLYGVAFASWNRPINKDINGDLPILAFPMDNSLATLNSDGKFLQYSTGLDNLLNDYKDPSGIFVYGAVEGVAKVPYNNNVKVSIAEDAVLIQADNAPDFKATVGITFDNSDKGAHAVDNQGVHLKYDWHMMSTPLQDAAFGTTYKPNATIGYGQPVDIQSMVNGYFPNGLPMGAEYEDGVKWDFYTYYEPQYHWINFKRSINNHWHYDIINHTHPNIPYAEADQTTGKFTPGKGYMMAISQDSYMSNSGVLNNGDVTIKLTNQEPNDLKYNKGWNLVGNPYQAYLNVSS